MLTYRRRHEPEYNTEHDIRDDCVTIVSPEDGSTLDERCLYDVMTSRPDLFLLDVQVLFKDVKFKDEVLDLFHANSVRFMPPSVEGRDDPIYSAWNVIVCIRHQDTVAIFDWEKGTLLWSWGQGDVSGPHHAAVLDNGNLLIFDNGIGRKWSRVIELDPLTRRIVWEYRASIPSDFFSRTRGANQHLPNGNTLITQSEIGRAFEVTPDLDIVWEFLVPYLNEDDRRATIMRLYRYESGFVEGLLKDHESHPAYGAPQR